MYISLFALAIVAAYLATMLRFVGPKHELIITWLGTKPIKVIKTGIGLTWPWPFGFGHAYVSTAVRASKVKVQIKSKDDMVFDLPCTIQHEVIDSLKYAIERQMPVQQMENLAVAAIRAAANGA